MRRLWGKALRFRNVLPTPSGIASPIGSRSGRKEASSASFSTSRKTPFRSPYSSVSTFRV
jgi:hypothetical protein